MRAAALCLCARASAVHSLIHRSRLQQVMSRSIQPLPISYHPRYTMLHHRHSVAPLASHAKRSLFRRVLAAATARARTRTRQGAETQVSEPDTKRVRFTEPAPTGTSNPLAGGVPPDTAAVADGRWFERAPTTAHTTVSDGAHIAAVRREMMGYKQHFSKVASRFQFQDNPRAYLSWVTQFQGEVESWGLESTLTDRGDVNDADQALRQEAVFYMISNCVPPHMLAAITVKDPTIPGSHRSAFHAWAVLRRFYIGDEATYLQTLEARMHSIVWGAHEPFQALEVRLAMVLSELEMMGHPKEDHLKKMTMLSAIQRSDRRDVRGASVYATFDVTAQVHHQASYHDWMGHMRLTAQRVEGVGEHVPARGVKRSHDASAHDAVPVNAVSTAPAMNHHRRDATQSAGSARTSSVPCFNWQNTGACKYGSVCKYSHAGGPSKSKRPQQPSGEVCREFRDYGRCRWGKECRHEHTSLSQGQRGSRNLSAGTGANASPIGHTAVSAESDDKGQY